MSNVSQSTRDLGKNVDQIIDRCAGLSFKKLLAHLLYTDTDIRSNMSFWKFAREGDALPKITKPFVEIIVIVIMIVFISECNFTIDQNLILTFEWQLALEGTDSIMFVVLHGKWKLS